MIVLFDVDGVLADFVGHIRAKCGVTSEIREMDLRESLTPEEMDRVLHHGAQEGFCSEIPWIPGADDFLYEVNAEHDVFIVTAPWHSTTWDSERRKWLSSHVKPSRVISCSPTAKPLVRGDILIEDHPQTAHAWLNANPKGLALLVDLPWNRPGTKTFDTTGHHLRMLRVENYDQARFLINKRAAW